MKTIYIAYCRDRHCDPELKAFVDREKAIEYARQFMLTNMAHPENITEERIGGYEAYFGYIENDRAYVVATELID